MSISSVLDWTSIYFSIRVASSAATVLVFVLDRLFCMLCDTRAAIVATGWLRVELYAGRKLRASDFAWTREKRVRKDEIKLTATTIHRHTRTITLFLSKN